MKKLVALMLAALMLLAVAMPAMAEDEVIVAYLAKNTVDAFHATMNNNAAEILDAMMEEGLIEGNVAPTPVTQTNKEIRESGVLGDVVKAMDHEVDTAAAYEALEKGAVDAYQKIESGVVGTYKKIEDGVVSAYKKMEDHIVEKLFSKDGETVEETKDRLRGK